MLVLGILGVTVAAEGRGGSVTSVPPSDTVSALSRVKPRGELARKAQPTHQKPQEDNSSSCDTAKESVLPATVVGSKNKPLSESEADRTEAELTATDRTEAERTETVDQSQSLLAKAIAALSLALDYICAAAATVFEGSISILPATSLLCATIGRLQCHSRVQGDIRRGLFT